MRWGDTGAIGFQGNRNGHLVRPSVAPLCHQPCPVPTRLACGVSGFGNRQMLASSLAQPCSANPPCSTTEPACGLSVGWNRRVLNDFLFMNALHSWLPTSIPTDTYSFFQFFCIQGISNDKREQFDVNKTPKTPTFTTSAYAVLQETNYFSFLSADKWTKNCFASVNKPAESKTRTHNARVGSTQRTADGGAGRRWANQGADISVGLEGNRPSSPPGYH